MSETDSDSVEPIEPNTNEPTTEPAAEPATESATSDTALAEAEAKAAENWDRYLRSAAELDNVRKRAARDVDQARKFAVERFAGDLLAVADSLSMGLDAADSSSVERLREGTEATLKLLNQVFERFGIAVVDPHGEPFDPEHHEAMTMQPSPDAEPGSVLAVVQRGYTLNGRLLRPARVVVAAEVPETSGDA
ncbi:MAG: nucleotide exchange factor GrpE [Pseudomonadota bacterium]